MLWNFDEHDIISWISGISKGMILFSLVRSVSWKMHLGVLGIITINGYRSGVTRINISPFSDNEWIVRENLMDNRCSSQHYPDDTGSAASRFFLYREWLRICGLPWSHNRNRLDKTGIGFPVYSGGGKYDSDENESIQYRKEGEFHSTSWITCSLDIAFEPQFGHFSKSTTFLPSKKLRG